MVQTIKCSISKFRKLIPCEIPVNRIISKHLSNPFRMNRRFVLNKFSNHSKITPKISEEKPRFCYVKWLQKRFVILESFTKLKKGLWRRLDFRVYQVDYSSSSSSSSSSLSPSSSSASSADTIVSHQQCHVLYLQSLEPRTVLEYSKSQFFDAVVL